MLLRSVTTSQLHEIREFLKQEKKSWDKQDTVDQYKLKMKSSADQNILADRSVGKVEKRQPFHVPSVLRIKCQWAKSYWKRTLELESTQDISEQHQL